MKTRSLPKLFDSKYKNLLSADRVIWTLLKEVSKKAYALATCTLEKITNLKFNIFYGSHKNLTKFPSFSLTLLYTIIEKFLGKINFTSLQCAAVVCQGRCSEGRSKNIAKSHIDSATLMTWNWFHHHLWKSWVATEIVKASRLLGLQFDPSPTKLGPCHVLLIKTISQV